MVFRSRRWVAGFVVLIGLTAAAPAVAQKPGGILQMLDFASPASMSIHEESTITAGIPMMGVFNNLVVFDQHVAQNSLRIDRPRSRDRMALERGRQGADLPAAPRRQMARRQAVHRRRRQMHLGPPARRRSGQVPPQSAQGLVSQCRRDHDQRRRRGHVSSEAAAALSGRAARLGAVAGLSLPRDDGARCGCTRSAPARSNSSNTSPTSISGWSATRITGSRAGPISTASSTRSSPARRPGSWPLSPASSISSSRRSRC